jgi:hypothetical protein
VPPNNRFLTPSPPKLTQHQRAEAVRRRDAGETLAVIAKSYGVAISMISIVRAKEIAPARV